MDIKKDHINFAVGPVQISEEISRIGADPVPYFRTPDFSALMKENEALLKEFMDAPEDARAVFLTGSGTASMDAVTQNVFTKDDRLLVVAGGSFGHRFCEICEVYGIPHTAIELRQGHALTPADLAPYAGQGYTGFLVNMHETSTGVLYDMDMISAFCRENGLVLVVDAISAFLADDVSMKRWGADVVFTGSQKALAVPPGISMMVLSSRAVERIYANRPACYYLDLKAALKKRGAGPDPLHSGGGHPYPDQCPPESDQTGRLCKRTGQDPCHCQGFPLPHREVSLPHRVRFPVLCGDAAVSQQSGGVRPPAVPDPEGRVRHYHLPQRRRAGG